MGTVYYLVDPVGRNVLDIGKAYWLGTAFEGGALLTAVEIELRAAKAGTDWRTPPSPAPAAWVREVCAGRRVELRSDESYDVAPWLAADNRDDCCIAAAGWTLYALNPHDPDPGDVCDWREYSAPIASGEA